MNNKGYTLIEILAVMILIAVVSTIAVISVSSHIDYSKRSTYVTSARQYIEKVSEARAKDKLHDIKSGEALVVPIERYKLDTSDDFTTPFGSLLLDYCYVVMTNNNNHYTYYIFMLDEKKNGIVGVEYSKLDSDSVIDGVDSIVGFSNINNSSTIVVDGTNYVLDTTTDRYIVLTKEGA